MIKLQEKLFENDSNYIFFIQWQNIIYWYINMKLNQLGFFNVAIQTMHGYGINLNTSRFWIYYSTLRICYIIGIFRRKGKQTEVEV